MRHRPDKYERFKELYGTQSISVIAERLGSNVATVHNWRRKYLKELAEKEKKE